MVIVYMNVEGEVSLLSVVSKILEKLAKKKFVDYLPSRHRT